jgi:lipopolysaccharide biosynthesis protein
VRPYVRHYIDALREAGFSVVFLTAGRALESESMAWLQSRCALVVRRRNVGRDFGAHKTGLNEIGDRSRFDRLLLVNDSVYGPFSDLEKVLADTDTSADVWSITDSWERRFHLQSFFLLLSPPAFQNAAFGAFWRRVRPVRSKWFLIRAYEVGLTRAMIKEGMRCKALYPSRVASQALVREVRERKLESDLSEPERKYRQRLFELLQKGQPINTSHFFWEYLIVEMGCPFLKRELLRRNPAGVPFLQYWEEVVTNQGGYDIDLILDDLEANVRNRSV